MWKMQRMRPALENTRGPKQRFLHSDFSFGKMMKINKGAKCLNVGESDETLWHRCYQKLFADIRHSSVPSRGVWNIF